MFFKASVDEGKKDSKGHRAATEDCMVVMTHLLYARMRAQWEKDTREGKYILLTNCTERCEGKQVCIEDPGPDPCFYDKSNERFYDRSNTILIQRPVFFRTFDVGTFKLKHRNKPRPKRDIVESTASASGIHL